jgi:aspartate/methionine/tyrosine aminotransferase
MTLFGISKTFAMPGVRLGWLCTRHPKIMESLKSFKDYTTICSPGPSEILSIIALRNKDVILDRTRRIIQTNLKVLDVFFKDYPDIFTWHAPMACTTGLLKLRGWVLELDKGGASGFCDKLVKDAEVLLLPSTMYDFRDDCVRLGFGREDLAEALVALRQFLENNKP